MIAAVLSLQGYMLGRLHGAILVSSLAQGALQDIAAAAGAKFSKAPMEAIRNKGAWLQGPDAKLWAT